MRNKMAEVYDNVIYEDDESKKKSVTKDTPTDDRRSSEITEKEERIDYF